MPANRILEKMLDRLYAALERGPSLNCRPRSSRQRVDLAELQGLGDLAPMSVFSALLGEKRRVHVAGRVPFPPELAHDPDADSEAVRAWKRQKKLLTRLRNLSEDARTYEQDTGVHALHVGYPILSLPPGLRGTRRVLAPIAFVPVSLTVNTSRKPGVELQCRGRGVDLVIPNVALLAWLERETGEPIDELFEDEEGQDPWREIQELVKLVTTRLGLEQTDGDSLSAEAPHGASADPRVSGIAPSGATADPAPDPHPDPADPDPDPAPDPADSAAPAPPQPNRALPDNDPPGAFHAVPRSEDLSPEPAVLTSAVVGLFPAANQGLLRDMRWMLDERDLTGPVQGFLDVDIELAPDVEGAEPDPDGERDSETAPRRFEDERFVAAADPFQSRAVARARESTGLVIHGPPGTGKSQTISNIIGDHLARGQRVLFVSDKRTALDVVANRLEHLGLGRLCAVVHDPKRDQRDLYMSVRGALDDLPELETDPRAENKLAKVDAELQEIHEELTRAHRALMAGGFHELAGAWLSLDAPRLEAEPVAFAELNNAERDVRVILERADASDFARNAWRHAAGAQLDVYVSRPVDEVRRALASCAEDARIADRRRDEIIPPFRAGLALDAQVNAREELAARLRARKNPDVWQLGTAMSAEDVTRHLAALDGVKDERALAAPPLDRELKLAAEGVAVPPSREGASARQAPSLLSLNRSLGDLEAYLAVEPKWWSWFAFGKKNAARIVLRAYGLDLPDADRLRAFLAAVRARLLVGDVLSEIDATLEFDALPALEHTLTTLLFADGEAGLGDLVRADADALLPGLDASGPRAESLAELERSLGGLGLFAPEWQAEATRRFREGGEAVPVLERLQADFGALEDVLRVQDGLARLSDALRAAVTAALAATLPAEAAWTALRRASLEGELRGRLRQDEGLQRLDPERLEQALARHAALENKKQSHVVAAVQHLWASLQRARLLAGTGSRLNSTGASLRRRLYVRGARAMRLRQVIAAGQDVSESADSGAPLDGGAKGTETGGSGTRGKGTDPLFDMCPVWMASPETVAQLFAREPVFDVVVFDEASQCRLEEALPVLLRAKRAVIAGDPKQLPPTRFFEAALATSEDDDIDETEQGLFEAQQGEVEDLLGAALNLAVDEAYLDVHYRSRNPDLIAFSNEHFYRSRLQAVPGHPSQLGVQPPLRLRRADGIYKSGTNRREAEHVVELIAEMLGRRNPPSIGVACFNVKQRDLVLDVLDDRAGEDEDFADRAAQARERRGGGSFEGLFVRNLENVQGDERDVMIISTTYGPNEEGRFYRRFGPLGQAGGGRRLNVLVTRARSEVHLVTSIPRDAYLMLEPLTGDRTPSGVWLLFRYLQFAEELASSYASGSGSGSGDTGKKRGEALEGGRVVEHPIAPVSPFAMGLSRTLARDLGLSIDAHWGNHGFCIDAALHHSDKNGNATLGILCDFTRYPHAPDPVAWEVFRTAILRANGWNLHRVWTPRFFRDPPAALERIRQAVAGEPGRG